MSSCVISTREFVGLLTDAILTASDDPEQPTLSTVLLHTDHAVIDTEPSEVLVATSTNRRMAGQGHAPCEGSWHRPVLLSVVDAGNFVKVFTTLAKGAPKGAQHQVMITVEGERVEVVEHLVSGGVKVTSWAQDLEYFPRGLGTALNPDPGRAYVEDGVMIPASYGTGLVGSECAVVGKVSKRRGMPAVVYRSHQLRPLVGSMWRGVFSPIRLEEGVLYDGPGVPVFEPALPPVKVPDQHPVVVAGS